MINIFQFPFLQLMMSRFTEFGKWEIAGKQIDETHNANIN